MFPASLLYSIRLCSHRSFSIWSRRVGGTCRVFDRSCMLCHKLSFIRSKNRPSLVIFLPFWLLFGGIAILGLGMTGIVYLLGFYRRLF